MYNRYIPQADGSFRKTKLPEPPQQSAQEFSGNPDYIPCQAPETHANCNSGPGNLGIGSFLRNLFPHGLDVEDLIVILLLLLLSQDGGKNGNRALLTLGAYLFL